MGIEELHPSARRGCDQGVSPLILVTEGEAYNSGNSKRDGTGLRMSLKQPTQTFRLSPKSKEQVTQDTSTHAVSPYSSIIIVG
jgi:hypothetical protein